MEHDMDRHLYSFRPTAVRRIVTAALAVTLGAVAGSVQADLNPATMAKRIADLSSAEMAFVE